MLWNKHAWSQIQTKEQRKKQKAKGKKQKAKGKRQKAKGRKQKAKSSEGWRVQSQRFVRTNVKRAMEIYIRVESRKGEEEDKKKEQIVILHTINIIVCF